MRLWQALLPVCSASADAIGISERSSVAVSPRGADYLIRSAQRAAPNFFKERPGNRFLPAGTGQIFEFFF